MKLPIFLFLLLPAFCIQLASAVEEMQQTVKTASPACTPISYISQQQQSPNASDFNPGEIVSGISSQISPFAPAAEVLVPPATPVLSGIANLASLLNFLATSSEPNPVVKELQDIKIQLENLGNQLSASVNDINSFFVNHEFTTTHLERANVLYDMVLKMVEKPKNFTRNEFNKECEQDKPTMLFRNLKQYFESTNPLLWAMNGDPMMSRATFNNMKKTTYGLLYKLEIIQSFYSGGKAICKEELEKTDNDVQDVINECRTIIDNIFNEYKAPYWPSVVENVIHEAQDKHKSFDYKKKYIGYQKTANYIKKQLELIYTTDEFYIVVYNDFYGFDHHAMIGQFVHSFRRGGCNVIVSRSSKRYQMGADDAKMNMIEEELGKYDYCNAPKLESNSPEYLRPEMAKLHSLLKPGFTAIICPDYHKYVQDDVAITWTGAEPGSFVWGEGYTCERLFDVIPYSCSLVDCMIIVGYP